MAKKNKRNESYLSIRKKLIAAVAMLLVASFMVASSSYAWFTLSTAPEVTGIQTTVGANGSLEIALLDEDGQLPEESTTNDGNGTAAEKNLTWGNLVDLSDDSYGLKNIVLKPARLKATKNADGKYVLPTTGLLAVAEYGADGRITGLNATNTVFGAYNNNAFGVGTFGVRAVGTTTTMTRQQLVFNSAKSAAIMNINSAKSYAVNSLTVNGPKLAKVLTAKAADDGTATYDLTCVAAIITDLQKANDALEAAIRAYYDAFVAKALETYTDAEFNAALATLDLANKDLSVLIGGFQVTVAATTVSIPAVTDGTALHEAYDLWAANNTALTAADTEYKLAGVGANATIDQLKWSTTTPSVSSILISSGLVNIQNATLNGSTAEKVKENVADIAASVLKDGITVAFSTGSGVYANIAQATSDYKTNITFETGTTVTANGISLALDGMKAVMQVNATPKYNISANSDNGEVTAVWNNAPAERAGNDADATIADAFAYMIDLAFRTNASDSKLMLQTEATGRIYGNDGGTEATMGHGATMTFQSMDPNKFSTGQVQALMDAVRVVFVDGSNTIIAVGVLDTNAAQIEGLEVTAELKLVDATIDGEGKITYTETTTTGEGAGATTTTTIKWKEDASLMSLQQNTATKLSVLVYLDGDQVTNADVATGEYSVSGTLNLQFSSNADLKPMEYAKLMNADGTIVEDEEEPTIVIDAISATVGAEVVLPTTAKVNNEDKNITGWAVKTAGATGATVTDGKLNATAAGEVVLTATIDGGKTHDVTVTVTTQG